MSTTMNLLGKQEQGKGDSAEIEMDAILELAWCSRENKGCLEEEKLIQGKTKS